MAWFTGAKEMRLGLWVGQHPKTLFWVAPPFVWFLLKGNLGGSGVPGF